jgi:hypothetical protein
MLVTATALAADGWIGGGVEGKVAYDDDARALDPGGQVELDARLESGPIFLRLDYDLEYDLGAGLTNVGWGPEWAMVQIGREGPRARLGVVNPNVALEDWDDRLNYLPTTSACFTWGAGRVLGADLGWQVADGPDVFVFGGWDLDYAELGASWTAGAGVFYEGDRASVWSGVVGYPLLHRYFAIPSAEFYIGDSATLAVDTMAGTVDSNPVFTGQAVVALFTESAFSPVGRVEVVVDPAGALDLPDDDFYTQAGSASLGFNFWPMRMQHADDPKLADALEIQVEGRFYRPNEREGGLAYPGLYLAVSLWRPEPDPFTARYGE